MLPLELLRTKITNKGQRITPLFCLASVDNLSIAQKLITEFELSNNKKETKGDLQKRLFLYENSYSDFKLIRGLIALLERRCVFKINQFFSSDYKNHLFSTQLPSSYSLRKMLFEVSSRDGLSVDHAKRDKIFQHVASKLGIDTNYLEKLMWLDQEDYLILESFSSIKPKHLLGIYNLSILQTLLFNSVNFEFTVKGGTNWKQVLRTIKRFGLMYNLQKTQKNSDSKFRKEIQSDQTEQNVIDGDGDDDYLNSYFKDSIICSVDGPLSIFKLTNKYGTLIAKVIPKIISAAPWSIKASIIKNSLSGRKIYDFDLSSDSDVYFFNSINDRFYNDNPFQDSNSINLDFDSSVEAKFAIQFEKF